MLVLIRIRETNRSQIPRVGEEKTQASSHLRPPTQFHCRFLVALPSDPNAWVSCLFCGPGDSTTNGHPRFYLLLTPTGGPFARDVRCCSGVYVLYPIQWAEAVEERGGTYSSRALTCWLVVPPELPSLHRVNFWGLPQVQWGGYRFLYPCSTMRSWKHPTRWNMVFPLSYARYVSFWRYSRQTRITPQ